MWTDCLTSIIHVLKLNGYKGRQAKVGEKRQCFKGWESLVTFYYEYDSLGRLRKVKDHQGHITQQYQYQYKK